MPETRDLLEAELPRLRRYARHLTRTNPSWADDLVQDTVLRALNKLHLWTKGSDLRAWLFTIMHNQSVNFVRKAVREGIAVDAAETDHPKLSVRGNNDAGLLKRDLLKGFDQLSTEHQVVLYMISIDGMKYDEVAAILGIPVGTVRSRLSRGRAALRELMGEEPARKRKRRLHVRPNHWRKKRGNPRLVVTAGDVDGDDHGGTTIPVAGDGGDLPGGRPHIDLSAIGDGRRYAA